MNIADLNPGKIFIQSDQPNENDHWWPLGWKIISNEEGKEEIDAVSGLNKNEQYRNYEHEYATIKPNQTIIGVYGQLDGLNDLYSVGFIVKEEVLLETTQKAAK